MCNLQEGKPRPFHRAMWWPRSNPLNAYHLWPSDSMPMNLPQGNGQGCIHWSVTADMFDAVKQPDGKASKQACVCHTPCSAPQPLALSAPVVHNARHGPSLLLHPCLGGSRLFCFKTFLHATKGHSAYIRQSRERRDSQLMDHHPSMKKEIGEWMPPICLPPVRPLWGLFYMIPEKDSMGLSTSCPPWSTAP